MNLSTSPDHDRECEPELPLQEMEEEGLEEAVDTAASLDGAEIELEPEPPVPPVPIPRGEFSPACLPADLLDRFDELLTAQDYLEEVRAFIDEKVLPAAPGDRAGLIRQFADAPESRPLGLIHLASLLSPQERAERRNYDAILNRAFTDLEGPVPLDPEQRQAVVAVLAGFMLEALEAKPTYDIIGEVKDLGSLYHKASLALRRYPEVGHPALELANRLDTLPQGHPEVGEVTQALADLSRTSEVAVALLSDRLERKLDGEAVSLDLAVALKPLAEWVGRQPTANVPDQAPGKVAENIARLLLGESGLSGILTKRGCLDPEPYSKEEPLLRIPHAERESFVREVYAAMGINGLENTEILPKFMIADYDTLGMQPFLLVAVDAGMTTFEEEQRAFAAQVSSPFRPLSLEHDHPYPQALWALYQAATVQANPGPYLNLLAKHVNEGRALGLSWDAYRTAQNTWYR